MYLKSLHIKNFRAIKDCDFIFSKGLNTIIGENNSGKTALIDALRICFSYGNLRRDVYVKREDFHIDRANSNADLFPIEFHLTFEIESESETGIFYELLVRNDTKKLLMLHFKYTLEERKGVEKLKWKVWGGEKEGQTVPQEILELIYFVYLGALRDAEQELRPMRGNKIGELLSTLTKDKAGNVIDKEKRTQMADELTKNVNENEKWNSLIEYGNEKINDHLNETSIKDKELSVKINFWPFEFKRIVENLRLLIPLKNGINDNTTRHFSLSQNGLGYNNLIYIATVLGDVFNRKENVEPETYCAILIEEPEAHLHPQLQNIFFNYMNKIEQNKIQLFITSHSPTITSKVKIDSLIVIQSVNNVITSLSIKNSGLSEPNKKFLEKFLDVTKSQMFFSNGCILVEGISEALLLPVFSKLIGQKQEHDIEKNGIEIVNLCGVSFEHFSNLYNPDSELKRLNSKCSVITDGDNEPGDNEFPQRVANVKALEKNNLKVFIADVTFEYELYLKNSDIIAKIYSDMHPKTKFDGSDIKEKAKIFLEKLKSNEDKSELAYNLAIKLDTDMDLRKNFIIPDYIQNAIKWITSKNV
jgi:putative ATP-dependent endonuclease of OLD family